MGRTTPRIYWFTGTAVTWQYTIRIRIYVLFCIIHGKESKLKFEYCTLLHFSLLTPGWTIESLWNTWIWKYHSSVVTHDWPSKKMLSDKLYVNLCDIGDKGYILIPCLNTRRQQIPCDRSYTVTLKQKHFEFFYDAK